MKSNPQIKIELVVRRVPNYLILTGVILSDTFSAKDLSAMEMYGKRNHDGSVQLSVKKEQYKPKTMFNSSLEDYSLTDLATEDLWRRYETQDKTEFGGVIMGRDNLLFDFEDAASTSRMAVISVIEDKENILDIDDHAILRSVEAVEFGDNYEFKLEVDKSNELLKELKGDSLKSFYTRPLFSLHDGTPYRLSSDLPAHIRAIYRKQYEEISCDGVVSDSTEQEMREKYLLVNTDQDYIEFVREMSKRQPIKIEMFDRLLTESEIAAIDKSVDELVRETMGDI